MLHRARVAGEQQAARRVAVEAVHRDRRPQEAQLQLIDPCFDAVPARPRSIDG
jgi:hypothetical protein